MHRKEVRKGCFSKNALRRERGGEGEEIGAQTRGGGVGDSRNEVENIEDGRRRLGRQKKKGRCLGQKRRFSTEDDREKGERDGKKEGDKRIDRRKILSRNRGNVEEKLFCNNRKERFKGDVASKEEESRRSNKKVRLRRGVQKTVG